MSVRKSYKKHTAPDPVPNPTPCSPTVWAPAYVRSFPAHALPHRCCASADKLAEEISSVSHTAATMGAKAGLFNQATGACDPPHMAAICCISAMPPCAGLCTHASIYSHDSIALLLLSLSALCGVRLGWPNLKVR